MIDASVAKRAFLDALAVGESGGRYDILCGGGRLTDYSQFPEWSGFQGPAGISHAAGKYQFEPATWQEEAQKLGLKDFSPQSQDAGAWDLASTVYQRRTGRDLQADLLAGNLSQIPSALHSTWTSLGSSFAARYQKEVSALDGLQIPPRPTVPKSTSQPTPSVPPLSHVGAAASGGVGAFLPAKTLVDTVAAIINQTGFTEALQNEWIATLVLIFGFLIHWKITAAIQDKIERDLQA